MAGPSDPKTEKVAGIIRRLHPGVMSNVLVVGCGDGNEAAVLARSLGAKVVGIDVNADFNADAAAIADLRVGDAEELTFEDESFDLIYSYHALEHIRRPTKALEEMYRVLRPGGGVWIGTPNRSRLVGYVGSAGSTFGQKIRWNWVDWRARIAGRFRNELGAHAGYTSHELKSMLCSVFDNVTEVTDAYFHTMYPRLINVLMALNSISACRFIYPGIYFTAEKTVRRDR